VLGTLYHGYFFAFHLLHIINTNVLLEAAIKAVTANGISACVAVRLRNPTCSKIRQTSVGLACGWEC